MAEAPDTTSTGWVSPTRTLASWVAALADGAVILVFAALGRRTHDELLDPVAVVGTAWPFLAGAAIGWLVCVKRRNRLTVRTGIAAWVGAWSVGMLLRALTGAGTAHAFMIVAALFLALLPGWRLVWLGSARLRGRSSRARRSPSR